MPWQRHVLDVMLEHDPVTGELAYQTVIVVVPRQSGKTTIELVNIVLRCTLWPRQNVVYTAQDRNMAFKKWKFEHCRRIERSKAFREGRDYKIRWSTGSEAIEFPRTDSLYSISATQESSGHGETLHLACIDEAFAHRTPEVDQSFLPPMATSWSPQMLIASTAGTFRSLYLNEKRRLGREAVERGDLHDVAHFEWVAPDDCDHLDREVWRQVMPALGHTITERRIAKFAGAMPEAEFRRAFLNQTKMEEEISTGMDLEAWSRQVAAVEIDHGMVMAVDGAPDRQWGSLAAAGHRADGDLVGELVDTRPGLGWLGPRTIEVARRQGISTVAVDPSSSAGSIIPELEAAGLKVHKMPARAHAWAAGALYDRVVDGVFWHRGQGDVQAAVVAARKRPLGDAWAWDRRNDEDNLTPLVAITLAVGAVLETAEAPEEPSVYDELEGFGDW